ncbi:hypothetical protein K458DRAFT_300821 [Lentithecium fluviatile CBS 122367]|uniref:Cytochrome P450 n=1 Tax=Lentithecium fluviatile CBS 122367 TaxID=1168545 RepID=A0A6G1J3Y2_9PLEO|nr:hypothetical protein K458DRAFT_300821 [Lentithecium fluviatile CBS 122367]
MQAATKMNGDFPEGNWQATKATAIGARSKYMQRYKTSFNLSGLVQFVTLRVSLGYLFDDAMGLMDQYDSFENIEYIGRRTNQLWIESKADEGQRPQWKNEKRLHKALNAVTTLSLPTKNMPGAFPSTSQEQDPDPLEPRLNPMNLLLPAYETMWRVVLRCLLEVRYRNETTSGDWIQALKAYLEKLDDRSESPGEAFWKASDKGVTVIDIVKEALRLYPPSRRIHRAFGDRIEKADIERCQRSQLLGQNDPLVFRPARWQSICPETRANVFAGQDGSKGNLKKEEEKLGFMPFAFTCTADVRDTRGFGMKMIALLVAVLIDGLDDWRLEGQEADEVMENACPLDTNRHSLASLRLDHD